MNVGERIPEVLGIDQEGREIKTKIHAEQILNYIQNEKQ